MRFTAKLLLRLLPSPVILGWSELDSMIGKSGFEFPVIVAWVEGSTRMVVYPGSHVQWVVP